MHTPNTGFLPLLEYCAEETARQYYHREGYEAARAVIRMVHAWHNAIHRHAESMKATIEDHPDIKPPSFSPDDVKRWASIIEPEKNLLGYRTVGVRVGSDIKARPSEVPALMERFFEHLPAMKPEEAYFAFEEIHPFLDGNGRVGKIILNWKNNSLLNPIWPTNKWGILNP